MSKVQLYLCGGAAINIGGNFVERANQPHPGFADLGVVLLDTSRSNLPPELDSHFYHIQGVDEEGTDGSGKVRSANYKAMVEALPEILHQYPPGDLSIIVHSGSGGSGSTLGGVVMSELLSRGKPAIAIMVGSTTCEKEIENTISSLHSYQSIAEKRHHPVVVHYLENGMKSMSENDAEARLMVLLLAATWSGQNKGLDSKDLAHFLNYPKVTSHEAALTGLVVHAGAIGSLEKGEAISSVVSLIRDGEDPDPGILVGYHSFGKLSPAGDESVKIASPIHLTTTQGYFSPILSRLQAKLAEAKENYKVRPVAKLKINAVSDDNGMIL